MSRSTEGRRAPLAGARASSRGGAGRDFRSFAEGVVATLRRSRQLRGGRLPLYLALACVLSGCNRESANAPTKSPLDEKAIADEERKQLRNAAEIAYSSGKYEQAVEHFTALIRSAPEDESNYFWRAQAHERLGQFDKAESDLNEAIRLVPGEAEPLLRRAELHYARGRLREAFLDCTKAIELGGPHTAGAHTMRAGLHLQEKGYSRALEDCNRALELDPEFVRAYNNRGLARQALGDFRGAIDDFSSAIERHRQVSEAYNNRGAVYMELRETQRALADLNEAIRLAPLAPAGYDNRSRLFLEQLRQPEEAAKDCTRLIQVVEREAKTRKSAVTGRKTAAIYARRAAAEWQMGQAANALADCQAALAIDAGCKAAQQLLKEIATKEQEARTKSLSQN